MSAKIAEIQARRARLVQRAAAERDELAAHVRTWEGAWSVAYRGLSLANSVRRHAPILGTGLGIGVVALVSAKPQLATVAWRAAPMLWRLGGSVKRLVEGLLR